jgi:hypothetical protein
MSSSFSHMNFPIDATPFGLSYPQWTVEWWRWLLSIPKEKSPALDPTGMFCNTFQKDPNVWFLAGTFGGVDHRKCIVPFGRAIFMPIINYECSFAGSHNMREESELVSKCREEIGDIKDITFEINNNSLKNVSAYRVRSPLFAVRLIENNVLGLGPGVTQMVTDGFWIFLKPLNSGTHKITSLASCRSGKIRIGACYEIHID